MTPHTFITSANFLDRGVGASPMFVQTVFGILAASGRIRKMFCT